MSGCHCRYLRAMGQNRHLVLLHLGRHVPSRMCQSSRHVLIDPIAVVGTVEELSASAQTLTLVRDQFETNYFGPVNVIKSILPKFRARRAGHIMILTGIIGHIGTPGLGSYCASTWALEGFCDVSDWTHPCMKTSALMSN